MSTPVAPGRWVIDSIEEHMVSIEIDGGAIIKLPQSVLPRGAREGDVLRVMIEIDAAGTTQAVADSAAQVKQASDASRKRDPGGDIAL
jgi:hypothetical protein